MLIHQAGYVHEYLRSKHIPLSLFSRPPLSLSLLPSLICLLFFLSLSLYPPPPLSLSIFPRSVRYIVAQPSFLSTLAPVAPTTRTLCENGDPSRSTPSTRRGGIAAPAAARKALEKWRRFVSRICAAPFFVFLYEGR